MLATALSNPAAAQARVPDMAALNPDNDGTVDLDEAQKAADALWAKLNTDGDETLEPGELTGRVDQAEFDAANPDGDQTLEKSEWTALVESRFKAADPDNDGTVDEQEFGTEAGQKLLALLQE